MILQGNRALKQNDFKNEKELQNFFEENIETILKYKFIETEFTVGNFRIDSLVYDETSKAFKIIEYKNIKNISLVDQGYTYLKLLIERKADFVLKYNEKTNSNLKIKDFDWTQSRIIFVSPSFTKYQIYATDLIDIPIDLIRVTRYEKDILNIEFIKKQSKVKLGEIKSNNEMERINSKIKVYTEQDHLKNIPDNIRDIYQELKNRILELDDIDIDVKKMYIAFKGATNIIDITLNQKYLKIFINMKKGTLNDKFSIAEDVSSKGHWGNGDYQVILKDKKDIDLVMLMVKQSLEKNKK